MIRFEPVSRRFPTGYTGSTTVRRRGQSAGVPPVRIPEARLRFRGRGEVGGRREKANSEEQGAAHEGGGAGKAHRLPA